MIRKWLGPMESKFANTCCMCKQRFEQGTLILWNPKPNGTTDAKHAMINECHVEKPAFKCARGGCNREKAKGFLFCDGCRRLKKAEQLGGIVAGPTTISRKEFEKVYSMLDNPCAEVPLKPEEKPLEFETHTLPGGAVGGVPFTFETQPKPTGRAWKEAQDWALAVPQDEVHRYGASGTRAKLPPDQGGSMPLTDFLTRHTIIGYEIDAYSNQYVFRYLPYPCGGEIRRPTPTKENEPMYFETVSLKLVGGEPVHADLPQTAKFLSAVPKTAGTVDLHFQCSGDGEPEDWVPTMSVKTFVAFGADEVVEGANVDGNSFQHGGNSYKYVTSANKGAAVLHVYERS